MQTSEHLFAQYVRTLGKGKTGSRSLSFNEAQSAMSMILEGQVEDVQLGAFLMLLRVKEESAEEIAGFVAASRLFINNQFSQIQTNKISADLDWSSYAGKRRQPPWYLLAAALLSQNGYRIFMHGAKGHTLDRLYTEEVLNAFNVDTAQTWEDCAQQLEQRNFAFMPLKQLCPPLHKMIQLRPLLGLRSPVHTLCRLLNPLNAQTTLQSVFHPAYAATHQQAAAILGEYNAAVFKGDGGEVEYRPQARLEVKCISAQQSDTYFIPRRAEAAEKMAVNTKMLLDLWQGKMNTEHGCSAVLGTAAIALLTMGKVTDFESAYQTAKHFWQARNKAQIFGSNISR